MRRALLSRIGGRDASAVDDVQSILAHLRVLLNTRQGDSPCLPGYGIMDFTDIVYSVPASVPQLVKNIRATILDYEPRLRNVTVRHLPDEDPLSLRFEISAVVAQSRSNRALRLSTTVHPGGRIDVSG